ncbi:hypothetical protein pb186bvf_007856 [Paramecium bursaria]
MQQDIKAVYQIDNKSVYDIRTLSLIRIKQFSIIEILKSFKHSVEKQDEKIKKLAIIIIFRGRKDIQDLIKDIFLNTNDPIKSMQRFQEFVKILQLYTEDDYNDALKTISQDQIEQLLRVYIEGNEIKQKYQAEILIQQIEKYFTQSIKKKVQTEDIRELLDHAFEVYENRNADQQNQQKEWDQVRKQYEEQQQKQQKDAEAASIKPINEYNQDFQDNPDIVFENQENIIQEQQIDFNLGQVIDLELVEKDQPMELEQINKEIKQQGIKPVTIIEEQKQIQQPCGKSKSFFELIQQSNNQKKQPQQELQQNNQTKGQQKKKLPTKLASENTDVYKQIQSQFIQLKGAVKNQKEQIIEEQKQNQMSVQGDEIQLWENIQEIIKDESWYEEINKQVESEQNSFIPILKRIAPITVSRWEKQQQIEKEQMRLQRVRDQQEKQQQEIRIEQEQQQKKLEEKQLERQQGKQQEKVAQNSVPQIEFYPIREEHSLFQSRLDYHKQLFKQKEKQEIKKQQNLIEIESSDEEIKQNLQKQQKNQTLFEIIDDEPQKPSEQKNTENQLDPHKDSNLNNQKQQSSKKDSYKTKPQQQVQEKIIISLINLEGMKIPVSTPQQESQIQQNLINPESEFPFYNDQELVFDESIDSLEIPNMETQALDLSQDVEILEDYTKKNNLKNQLDFYNNGLRPELKPLTNDQKAATLLSLLKLTKFNFTIRQVQQDKQQLLRDKAFHSFIRIIYNIVTNYLQERIKIQIKQIIHNASRFYGEITIQLPNGKQDQQQYEAENQYVVHTFLRLIGLDFIIKNVYGNKQDMTFLDIIKYLSAKISSKTYQEYKELTSTEVPIQQDTQPRVRNWEMIFYEEEKDNEFIDKVQSRIQPRTQPLQDAKLQALKNMQQQEYYKQTQKIQEQSIAPQKNQKEQSKQKQPSQKKQQKQDKSAKKMNQKKNKDISSEEEGEVKVDILEKVKQQQDTFEKSLMSKILQGIQVGIQEGIQQVQKSVDSKLQQIEEKQQITQKQLIQQSEQKDHKKKNSSKHDNSNKDQDKNNHLAKDNSNKNIDQNGNHNQNKDQIMNQNMNQNQNVNQHMNYDQNQNQNQNHNYNQNQNQNSHQNANKTYNQKSNQNSNTQITNQYKSLIKFIIIGFLEPSNYDYQNDNQDHQYKNNRKKSKLNPEQQNHGYNMNPEQQQQGYPTFNQIIPQDLQGNAPLQYGVYNQHPLQFAPPYQQYPPIQHQMPQQNHLPYAYHQYPLQNQYYPPNNQYNNQQMKQRKPNNRNWK